MNIFRSPMIASAHRRLRRAGSTTIVKIRTRLQWIKYNRLIGHSGLFNRDYYLSNNPDVATTSIDPLKHYFIRGASEGRDPHPLFNTRYYLSQNPDVAEAEVNPLAHYLARGAFEGRDPHPLFSSQYYLSQNPDLAGAQVNPLVHYLARGAFEGRDPHPLFKTQYYLSQNPDLAGARVNPLVHYLARGASEGRDPHPLFSSQYYLSQNPDVAGDLVNPLVHYLARGASEGRDPHPLFNTQYYLAENSDLASAQVNPLAHYLARGASEGLDPHPNFDGNYYWRQNPDVADAGLNPLAHYVGSGIAEGLDPNPFFDTSTYLEEHPEVALKGLNPLVHYLSFGSFDLRAALRNELSESGKLPLNSDHDSNPLVSIIVLCPHPDEFLEDAVLSGLLACSYSLEIIVLVNRYADRRSLALAEELAARYNFILVRVPHVNRANARNVGRERARGKFIQFLHTVDLIVPGKIDVQIDEFRSHPELTICISDYELWDATGYKHQRVDPSAMALFPASAKPPRSSRDRDFAVPIHCALFRRECLDIPTFELIGPADQLWTFYVEQSSQSPKISLNLSILAISRIVGEIA
jgi:glycosyl transferase family 2